MHELLREPPDAVLFDLDGTLYVQSPVRRRMALRILRHHATRPIALRRTVRTLSAYRRAQEEIRDSGFDGDVAAAQLELAAGRIGAGPHHVRTVVEYWMEQSPLDVMTRHRRADVIALVEGLATLGVRLGLVSDYPAGPKLAALGLADRFEVVVSAQDSDVGVFKPHPRGLLVALERLGVPPARACYVGDRLDVDLAAARAAGMPFVHVPAARGGRLADVHQTSAAQGGPTSKSSEESR